MCMLCYFFFFFKQKTAYEMLRSLVGSEMCIRDRYGKTRKCDATWGRQPCVEPNVRGSRTSATTTADATSATDGSTSADASTCLLYTSDAADEEDSVDLGGRRII
eukprot:TRINITY_DN1773_c0_g1_i4.p1 TRINITY_DN1773_c0_g1~~TRINITY_DN1773_c0_g1_i4.p1  ORF type:complete len:105 (-),score=40.02 TRINITY_DN1773_c0_g1_i4:114-428(-)